MLNRSGVTKTTLSAPKQILANVDLQSSVGCIVSAAVGGAGEISKAGTPIQIDFTDLQKPAVLATADVAMNAVLLHDVDTTKGDANGTALIFGFVNLNRLDEDVVALIETAQTAAAATKQVTFLKA